MAATPVWLWPPGMAEPCLAATLAVGASGGVWHFAPDFVGAGTPSPDPIRLPLGRGTRPIHFPGHDGLAGVVRDAMPQGYGADRLEAQAGRSLSPIELLEMGLPDSTGAIEVCADLERKLAWTPGRSEDLETLTGELEAEDPPSRAIRRLNGDVGTSQGGEKPKTTVVHRGALWLAKMRDRGGLSALPAREFVAMTLARRAGIDIPDMALVNAGAHQIFLVRRFDRHGDPLRPARRMVASAHTVLDLAPAAVRGEAARSYLVLADKLRRWAFDSADLPAHLQQLWQRMAFNALVGNTDDHPRNHAFLHDGTTWRLSPAFDITPAQQTTRDPSSVVLAMDVSAGQGRTSCASIETLLAASVHFGVPTEAAAQWLLATAADVTNHWPDLLRASVLETGTVRAAQVIEDCQPAFAFAHWVAEHPGLVEQHAATQKLKSAKRRR